MPNPLYVGLVGPKHSGAHEGPQAVGADDDVELFGLAVFKGERAAVGIDRDGGAPELECCRGQGSRERLDELAAQDSLDEGVSGRVRGLIPGAHRRRAEALSEAVCEDRALDRRPSGAIAFFKPMAASTAAPLILRPNPAPALGLWEAERSNTWTFASAPKRARMATAAASPAGPPPTMPTRRIDMPARDTIQL